jgi:hypothetical protein
VFTAFRAHRGRGKTFLVRSRVPFLHFSVQDRTSVPRRPPNAWIAADRQQAVGTGAASGAAPGVDHGHFLSFGTRALAKEYLKEVGRELGMPR